MIPIGTLLRRVVNGAAGTMEVLEGVSSLAPLRAKDNREDPWWTTERYEILRLIEALATRKALLSVRDAQRQLHEGTDDNYTCAS